MMLTASPRVFTVSGPPSLGSSDYGVETYKRPGVQEWVPGSCVRWVGVRVCVTELVPSGCPNLQLKV